MASGLARPTAMQFAPDGRLFVCQQGGALRVIKDGALLPTPFVTIPVNTLGSAACSAWPSTQSSPSISTVYVYYTTSTAPLHNRISRFTANGDVALAGSES